MGIKGEGGSIGSRHGVGPLRNKKAEEGLASPLCKNWLDTWMDRGGHAAP